MTVTIQLIRRRRRGTDAAPPVAPLVLDSFNRPNNLIGSTDGGTLGPLPWTTTTANWVIASNQLAPSAPAGESYATIPAGVTDMDVRATFPARPNTAGNIGLVGRATDSNNFYLTQFNNLGVLQLFKRVAGVFTQLAAPTPQQTFLAGDELGLRIVGPAITVTRNGITTLTASDGALTAGTRAGFRDDGGNAWRADNFSVAAP